MRIVAASSPPPRSATPDVDAAPPSAAARRTALSALAVSARIASATSRLARSCTSTCWVSSSLRSASAARDEGSEVSGSPPPVRPAVSVISHAASISASISLPLASTTMRDAVVSSRSFSARRGGDFAVGSGARVPRRAAGRASARSASGVISAPFPISRGAVAYVEGAAVGGRGTGRSRGRFPNWCYTRVAAARARSTCTR